MALITLFHSQSVAVVVVTSCMKRSSLKLQASAETTGNEYNYCCRKTAVCIGDQFLDFSVLELVRSQSTFSTDPEVLQNCAAFTLCIGQFGRFKSGRMFCSNGFDAMHVVCTDLLCVVCIGLLSAEISTVCTGLAYVLETSVSVEYS